MNKKTGIISFIIVAIALWGFFFFYPGSVYPQTTKATGCSWAMDDEYKVTGQCVIFSGNNNFNEGASVLLDTSDTRDTLLGIALQNTLLDRQDIRESTVTSRLLVDDTAKSYIEDLGVGTFVQACSSGDQPNTDLLCDLGMQEYWACGDPETEYDGWVNSKKDCYDYHDCDGTAWEDCWRTRHEYAPPTECSNPVYTKCRYANLGVIEDALTTTLVGANQQGSCQVGTSIGTACSSLRGRLWDAECAVSLNATDAVLSYVNYHMGVDDFDCSVPQDGNGNGGGGDGDEEGVGLFVLVLLGLIALLALLIYVLTKVIR